MERRTIMNTEHYAATRAFLQGCPATTAPLLPLPDLMIAVARWAKLPEPALSQHPRASDYIDFEAVIQAVHDVGFKFKPSIPGDSSQGGTIAISKKFVRQRYLGIID